MSLFGGLGGGMDVHARMGKTAWLRENVAPSDAEEGAVLSLVQVCRGCDADIQRWGDAGALTHCRAGRLARCVHPIDR